MKMKTTPLWTTTLCLACAQAAFAQDADEHLDLSPTLDAGRVFTNGWSDADAFFVPDQRVFGYEFGEIAGAPLFAGDPGFNVRPGSGFAPGSQMGFRVLNPLRYWNGADADADGSLTADDVLFTSPGAAELELSFGPVSRTVTGSSGALPDTFVGPAVDDDGAVHFHLSSSLSASGGEPMDGIYRLDLALLNSLAEPSEPVSVLFNLGLDEDAHEASLDAVRASLLPPTTPTDPVTPEPGVIPTPTAAAAGLAMMGAMLLRRKR